MCGIAGALILDGRLRVLMPAVVAMTRALAHRGPDDEGYVMENNGLAKLFSGRDSSPTLRAVLPDAEVGCDRPTRWAFGHRRFSIIDTAARAHQPMLDHRERSLLCFNGELYNYRELKRELAAAGDTFSTESDTEVMLAALTRWGVDALPKMNGMWGFAFADFRRGETILCRDRIGEKPLFYAEQDGVLYFASEIRALHAVPAIWARRAPDPDRVITYLGLGLRDHRSGSFFKDIEQIPPGSYLRIRQDGSRNLVKYWRLPETRWSTRDLSFDEASAGFLDRLTSSVALRLRADVPIAAELSGGLDSTSIVQIASRIIREQALPTLQTVTIKYHDPACDESPLAAEVARACDVPWQALTLEAADYWRSADDLLRIQEQPYESPNLLGSLTLWQHFRSQGIRVVLNGGGGDELIGGYLHQHLPPLIFEKILGGNLGGAIAEARAWQGLPYIHPTAMRRHLLFSLPKPFRRLYLNRMLGLPAFSVLRPCHLQDNERLMIDALAMSHARLSDTLPNNINFFPIPMYMTHGDKLAMSLPIEVRFPFLDPDLVEFAFHLPVDYLIRNGFSKAVLREPMRSRLPAAITGRREKMGFPVPLAAWMRAGKDAILAEVREGRVRGFVDTDILARDFDTMEPAMIWRIHQVARWMARFDLHHAPALPSKQRSPTPSPGVAVC
ncbi:MAG TPA: asparagine synthase (glutamine-hydrolyzing) [Kiritimatiellia bacterium]|nr:asparagine synthase (glutamine-hydrolyzing) [Kiritimatiellia bacterium]HMP33449.1 asparagine synthase (glutamine-hydrolyzing) [Kiritimatiellia bacterium]